MGYSNDKKARILVDAAYMGDKEAAGRHSVSARSIRRWRTELDDDRILSAAVLEKKELADKAWADDLPPAIAAAIDFLKRAAQEADTKDPQAIHSVAGALKILSTVAVTREILDARLAKRGGSNTTANRQVAEGHRRQATAELN